MAPAIARRGPCAGLAGVNDPGLISPAETCLFTDQYELAMAASYLEQGLNGPATFELFVRHLPAHRDWLLVAGLGPALGLVEAMRFGPAELRYLGSLGFAPRFLDYLGAFRFSGAVDAMPEGTVAFAEEPLLRVTAPRIEAQLLETLLLNQINFQTAIATKAGRLVLAAGAGAPGAGGAIVDFSARRDHGIDAAMKVARSAAIAGAAGTSNVAAARRFGLTPMGTMAHSYVMSFPTELDAFRAFMRDTPENSVLLVDTYDTVDGVRNAIAAARETRVPLSGVRLDSGDRLELSRVARALLDAAGMAEATIVASGDLDEHQIAAMVAAEAPIDVWGVGTELGTSRDSPAVGGVYKLVADQRDGRWRPVAKRSPAKATWPAAKQVFRETREGTIRRDVLALDGEALPGRPLLEPAMRHGRAVRSDSLETMRTRARAELASLPDALRQCTGDARETCPVVASERLVALTAAVRGMVDPQALEQLREPIPQRGPT